IMFEDEIVLRDSRTNLLIDAYTTDVYRVDGGMSMVAQGAFGEWDDWEIVINSDARLGMERFEKLVSHLDRSDWAIPAPFNTLSGFGACHFRGRIDLQKGQDKIPQECVVDFQGPKQVFKINSQGDFELIFSDEGIRPHMNAKIELVDV